MLALWVRYLVALGSISKVFRIVSARVVLALSVISLTTHNLCPIYARSNVFKSGVVRWD